MYETITVERVTSSLGARIGGVDLKKGLAEGQFEELRRALLDHLVIFLPGQDIDDEAQMAFTRLFGELRIHPVAEFLGHTNTLGTVGTDDYQPGSDSNFHTDYSFCDDTPDLAVLRALVVPSRGGDTMWVNMYEAYDALSTTMRSILDGLDAFHDQGQRFNEIVSERYGEEASRPIREQFSGRAHPVVIAHPVTNRRALFVNPGYTRHIVGMEAAESEAILSFLFAHLARPRFQCRYRWQPGDIAIWDERATVHMGEGAYWPEERMLHRYAVGRHAPRAARDSRSNAAASA